MGTNLQAQAHRRSETQQQLHFVNIIVFLFFLILLFIIRVGHLQIGQGASQYGQGAAPSEICLAGTLIRIVNDALVVVLAIHSWQMSDYCRDI